MNAKDLRTESALSERNNDGSKYSHSGGTAAHCDRNKSYQDIGSNSLAKVDIQPARPCAVIGPDRVVPPPAQNEAFVKKGSGEPWPCTDNAYYARRPPGYPHKLTNLQNPTRNISPRQTFQENMQRVMVPPSYNSVKLSDETNYAQMIERGNALSKNIKLNVPLDGKFDVPYTVYSPSNEQKNVRNPELCNVNSNIIRTAPPGWSPSNVNIRPTRTYGASELYQYPDYASCAVPRPVVPRPNRTVPEDSGYVYADQIYHQEGNIRYKPYPTVKERFPPQRYDYIGNYANSFHPPPVFPNHKYELQKSVPPHSYAPYPPMKYLDRVPESVLEGYQRNQQGSYNIPYRNQIIHPNYGPVPGNNPQNKIHSYPPDTLKPGGPNKLPFDNNKAYIEYQNGRPKMYPPSESYLINEIGRTHTMKGQVIMPNYPTLNMHNVPSNQYYKKDSQYMKNYEYMQAHYRSIDPNFNPMLRHQPVFSPSTLAISPTDSTASNDISQTLGANQEDCGYVSQSSTASGRSMDSGIHRIPNDCYVRKYYDHRYIRGPGPPVISKAELNTNNHSKDKKNIDVRQFLQMWNEGDEEAETNNSKEIVIQASSKNDSNFSKAHEVMKQPNQEQLYVLGLVNVPSEELAKYEHIQKVSKLPENIKGYNHIDLLKQFEQVTESSNMSGYAVSSPKDFQTPLKGFLSKQPTGVVPPRPISPLDVEAKISQSVIHKEVGCNFEIKPCSPKMLNVEVATPVQNILERERAIQKVANPGMLKSPRINSLDENIDCNMMKRKDHRINTNNEPNRIPSCKMVNTQFSSDSIDSIKNSYSLQDLESNSGLGLASLPRLDNEIELNFPEVNQQFINANKGDFIMSHALRDLPTLEVIDQAESSIKDSFDTINSLNRASEIIKSPCAVETEKEFSKLSKYRKGKVFSSDSTDNLNAVRTDSVIIKNPENIKNYEENLTSSPNFVNKEASSDIQKSPMNLTSQGNTSDKIDYSSTSINLDEACVIQGTIENAIDFSLNKNNTNDLTENSSTFETECADLSDVEETELPTFDTSNFDSILANHSIEQTTDDTSNDKNEIENTSSLHNSPVEEAMTPKCLSSVSCTENAMNIKEKQECLSPIASINDKENKTSFITKTSSIECIETVNHYSLDTDENIADVSDQLDALKCAFEKSEEDYDNLQKQQIDDENVDKDFINNVTTTSEKQPYNEGLEELSEFSNPKEVISKSDVPIPKNNDLNKDCDTEIIGSPCGVQSNHLTQPQINKPETESKFDLSPANKNVRHSVDNNQSETIMQKSSSLNLLASNDELKPSDCQSLTTEIESVCDTDFVSVKNRVPKLESNLNTHLDDTQKLGSKNSKLDVSEREQETDPDLDLPFSSNEIKYSSDWKLDISERKSDCSLNSPKDNLSEASQSDMDCDFNSLSANICKEDKAVVEFSKDNLTDLLDEISNCPMDIENVSEKYYEDVSILSSISVPVKEHKKHEITCSNKELRYLSYGSKEMYSPWIQKLIVTCEGSVNTVRKYISDKATYDRASDAQEAERLKDPCNFQCTLKENDISIIDSNVNNIIDCTNQIQADLNPNISDFKLGGDNISDIEYKNISDMEKSNPTQEVNYKVTPSVELKSHNIQELDKISILEHQVESIGISDKMATSHLGTLVSVAQVQSTTNDEAFKLEEELFNCNNEPPTTWSEKLDIKDKNFKDDTPEQWDKVSDCNYNISEHLVKVSNCDKISECSNKQINLDDEGLSVRVNQTNNQARCFVNEPEQKLQQYVCNNSKVTEHYRDNNEEVLERREQSVRNNVMIQQSDKQSKCELHSQLDKHTCSDDQISENTNKKTHYNDEISKQSDSQSHCSDELSKQCDKDSSCNNVIPEQLDKQSKGIDEMSVASDTHSVGDEIIEQSDKLSDYNDGISDESGKSSNDKDEEIHRNFNTQCSENNEPFHQSDNQVKLHDEYPKESDKKLSDYNDKISDESGKSSTNKDEELRENLNKQSSENNEPCHRSDKKVKLHDEYPKESDKQLSDYNDEISDESGKSSINKDEEICGDLNKPSSENNEPVHQSDKQVKLNDEYPKESDKQSNYKAEIFEQLDKQSNCNVELNDQLNKKSNCRNKINEEWEKPSRRNDDIFEQSNKQSDFADTTSESPTESYSNRINMLISEEKGLSEGKFDFKNEIPELNDEEFNCSNKTPKQIKTKSNSDAEICNGLNISPICTDKILARYDDDSNCNESFFQQVANRCNKIHDVVDQINQQSDFNDEILEQYDSSFNHSNGTGNDSDCCNNIIKEPSKPACNVTADEKGLATQESNEQSASEHGNPDQCIIFEQSTLQFDCNDDIFEELDDIQSDSGNIIHELQNKELEMNNTISQQSKDHSSVLPSIQCVQSDCHDEMMEKSNGEPVCNNDISVQNLSDCNVTEVELPRDDLFSLKTTSNEPNRLYKKQQSLKRSLSDSALNVYNNDKHTAQENETNVPLIWPFKRRKLNNLDNDIIAQNLCNIIQSTRRNSVASFYNEENVSFCILIDNSCIIAEEQESDEQEKICYAELSEEGFETIQNDCSNDIKNVETTEMDMTPQEETYCEYPESFIMPDEEENLEDAWVEDVACVETVISDYIAEDIEISEASSPKDYILSDNEESDIFGSSEHTDKVKYIYGDKMCNDDAQFVETLYNTPQMNVNKTLVQRETLISGEFYDKDSLEKLLSESNEPELPPCVPDYVNPVFSSGVRHTEDNIDNKLHMQNIQNAIEFVDINVDKNVGENESEKLFDETQDDTVHSCESSVDNVFKYTENDENTNQITSSSPEVSSTTSEEKGSAILLKITNYKGSRVSQVNDVRKDIKRPSCKFTEEEDYGQSQSNYSAHRPLLTKAAQKYIPPLKESIRDLKVKLPLPQHSLIKLKQLKKSKDETKTKKPNIPIPTISKKPKPKFEDVLKRIDEMQYELHSKKNPKKSKKSIPKVVIKKNENGSHYASTSNKEQYNPDLTGNKWQPWVFIEKNDFIDKMATRNKTKAIYSYRKRTYVLAEKFQKYKSVSSAKFVISPPISDRPSGLKYTIRLKHSY